MKRILLSVLLSSALLIGAVATPASAENPPGFPDLIGIAWGTTTPPPATVPTNLLEPDVPYGYASLYFADPEVVSGAFGPVSVGGPWMALEVWVTRPVDGDPDHLSGFAYSIAGLQSVSGATTTLVGWGRIRTIEITESAVTYGPNTPYYRSAVTLIDG